MPGYLQVPYAEVDNPEPILAEALVVLRLAYAPRQETGKRNTQISRIESAQNWSKQICIHNFPSQVSGELKSCKWSQQFCSLRQMFTIYINHIWILFFFLFFVGAKGLPFITFPNINWKNKRHL
jgi:hypothetical protein